MKHHYCFCKKLAFTLAEVLITLGIIGVVAAIVMPNVITKIEKQRNLAVLKKAYSDLENAIVAFDTEFDCDRNFSNCMPNKNEFASKFTQYLIEKHKYVYLNETIKSYRISTRTLRGTIPTLNVPGTTLTQNAGLGYWLLAPNGSYMYYIRVNMNDLYYTLNYIQGAVTDKYSRAIVSIFTNPKKSGLLTKTNSTNAYSTYGKDLFQACVANNRTVNPVGKPNAGFAYWCSSYTCDPESTDDYASLGCLQKIIQDGWQINYY